MKKELLNHIEERNDLFLNPSIKIDWKATIVEHQGIRLFLHSDDIMGNPLNSTLDFEYISKDMAISSIDDSKTFITFDDDIVMILPDNIQYDAKNQFVNEFAMIVANGLAGEKIWNILDNPLFGEIIIFKE